MIEIFYTSLHDMYRLCGLRRAIRIGLGCVRACVRAFDSRCCEVFIKNCVSVMYSVKCNSKIILGLYR